jgi:hypothetical protein
MVGRMFSLARRRGRLLGRVLHASVIPTSIFYVVGRLGETYFGWAHELNFSTQTVRFLGCGITVLIGSKRR